MNITSVNNDPVKIVQRRIYFTRPDDWHLHLREGEVMRAALPVSANRFHRALIMPNLETPVVTVQQAVSYRKKIQSLLPPGSTFVPYMTTYLTSDTDADDIENGFRSGDVLAVKHYPAGATHNSSHGVRDLKQVSAVLARMERLGMVLSVHGEVSDPEVDVFDREAVFIERVLKKVRKDFPELKIVLEHISTNRAVECVGDPEFAPIAATVTPHHMYWNRNALFEGGLQPHAYCRPLLKREFHRDCICRAVVGGAHPLFLGTDSAPHREHDKLSAGGCAGVFNVRAALETCAEIFEQYGSWSHFEPFVSLKGAEFYGVETPDRVEKICLERRSAEVPRSVATEGGSTIVHFRGGERLRWCRVFSTAGREEAK